MRTVLERTGLSRSTLYRKMRDGTFPKQVRISEHCCGWRESAINRKPHRDGWPTAVVAKDGRVATSINAGLRPPPPAAYGVDSACHPAVDCHVE
jgi:hypothetical protein